MVKRKIERRAAAAEETSLHRIKINQGGNGDEEIDGTSAKEEEEDDSGERKGKTKSGEEEEENSDDRSAREREESIAIPIEEDANDGKGSQKTSNTYAAKKTVAQGMMDIALITANANQLRYIIEFNRNSSTFYMTVILIILSLLLQVAVGLSLIFKGRLDLRGESKNRNAKRINNYVVVGVFLVTIINVFIASFTVTDGGANNGYNGKT